MNRFAKMKKERIYTLFETLSLTINVSIETFIQNHPNFTPKKKAIYSRKWLSFVTSVGLEPTAH